MNIKQLWKNGNRWQRLAAVLTILFTLYTLFGFFILPLIIKSQMIKQIHKVTHRAVTLENVLVNPLKLSMALQNFKVEGKKGEEFVGWDEFYFNFQISTLFRLTLTFDEIRLIKPVIFVEKATADTFNFSDLIPSQSANISESDESANEEKEILSLRINKLIFDNGRLHFRDSSRKRPADISLSSVSFMLENFKTRLKPDQNNTYDFMASGPKGGSLHWNGMFRLNPLESKGIIELSKIHLTSFANFYQDELQFTVRKGLFSFNTQYHLFKKNDWEAELSESACALTDILITEKEKEKPLFELPSFKINEVALSLKEQRISVGNIHIKDAKLNPHINKSGEVNLLRALDMSELTGKRNGENPKTDAAPPESSPHSWYWEVKQLSMDGTGIHFTDETPVKPFSYQVMPIDIHISDIVSDGHKPYHLTLSSVLNKNGTITAKGNGTLIPLTASVDITQKDFILKDFQPYIDRFAHIALLDGATESRLHIDVDINEKGEMTKLKAKGDAAIKDLNLKETVTNKDLLKGKAYAMEGLILDAMERSATIEKITLSEPSLNFQINEDMSTNLSKVMISSNTQTPDKPISTNGVSQTEPAPKKKAPETNPKPFRVLIKEILLENGSAGFSDHSLKPDFVTKIDSLNGRITDASNIPGKRVTLDLKGKVDRHAPVFIKGSSNLFSEPKKTDITVSFKKMAMSSFTPYSGTYAGYKIDKGQLSFDLKYLLNATRVKGDNKIVIQKLTFGDRVESEKAVKLPLKLAVALLSDTNGVINLDLDVQGDLNDPEFSIGGIFLKVLKNLIVKTISSPFALLAGLVGGSGDNFDVVNFSNGSDQLNDAEAKKVAKLAKALTKRPRLSINLRGQVAYHKDLQTLKQIHLDELLTTSSGINATEIGGILAAAKEENWRNTLLDLYKITFNESFEDVKTRLSEKALHQGKEMDTENLFNQVVETIYQALIEKQAVTEENLHLLADKRSQNIKVELVETHAIDPGRVFILESEVAPALDKSAVILTLDAL